MKWSTKQLRAFLNGRLNDTQLRTFVMDHHPELFTQISAWGQSYSDRVLLLIDYCYRQGQIEEIVDALTADFPEEMRAFLEQELNDKQPPEKKGEEDRLNVPAPDSWDGDC